MKLLTVLGDDLKVRVSPTFLDKAACPAALKFEYVDRVPAGRKIAARRGSVAHDAISDLTQVCINRDQQPQQLSDEEVHDAVMEHTSHELFDELPDIITWVRLWRDRYRLSKHMVGHEEKLAIDENHKETDWKVGTYRGIVDVIDINGTHCKITDYKSQPHILSQTDLDLHFQLTFYSWLVSKFYPFVKTFEVRIWYLRYGFYNTTPRTKAQLEEFEFGLNAKVDALMSIESWDPIPGSYCKWCEYSGLCPVGKPDENGKYPPLPDMIQNDEQATHYAKELRLLEVRRERLSEAVREYVKGKESPVTVSGDLVYGYKSSPSVFFPASKVIEAMRAHGVDPGQHASFSATKMKKIMKDAEQNHPALFRDLEEIAQEKVRTQFSAYELK